MTTQRLAEDRVTVTALLVSHEGARWLPAVLDGLDRQTRPPDRVVAVDTGSTDASPRLLRERLGDDSLLSAPATSSYGAAVAVGLSLLPPVRTVGDPGDPGDPGEGERTEEWVWLLHDDSAPAPDALDRLVAVVAASPSVDVLGPKLREWPSLRRLLEVGVTISGTGRRETGLERGEYDQGQHDRIRDVLAVNTAGMLVRRSVLESLGFDERLPLFGNDIDFGWRAARARHRTVVVPEAVVFHVEAAHREARRNPVGPARFRRAERSAALYTLLVNGSGWALPFTAVRLVLGSVVRALGLLLVRSPGHAVDETVAAVATLGRPWRLLAGRRHRRRTAMVPPRDVRHLLAPPWMPYRHGLDVLSDAAAAVVNRSGGTPGAHRAAAVSPGSGARGETGPVPAESENLPEDTGVLVRLLTSLVAWVFAALVVAALASARGLVGSGYLSGGALLPAPEGALDWWRLYLSSWHDIGTGSSAPAAPYVLPLAALGTLLLGKAWLLVDIVFLLAVPIAAIGAHRFLLRVTSSMSASLWGALAYGVLPVVSGSVQQGRLGTVAATLVLPWLAHAAIFLGPSHSDDRRRRAAWRTALWLALLTAFVPTAWLLAALVGAVALVSGLRGPGRARRMLGAVGTPLVATLVLLLPWTLATWSHQGATSWLFEAGLPAPRLTEALTRWDVALGRPAGSAPAWLSAGVLLAAVAALLRPDTRAAVLRAWVVLVAALAVTALLTAWTFSTPSAPAPQPLWLGFPLLVAQGAAITAAALAGTGIRHRLSGERFGWRQPIGVAVVLVAGLSPVVSLAWWVWSGSDGALDRGRVTAVPTYMTDAAAADPENGILVVRGSPARGFSYVLLRQPGLRIGDDSVLPSARDQAALTSYVENLASAPEATDVSRLSRLGVAYVYAPAPADVTLTGNLDGVSGTTAASATRPGARAWQLEPGAERTGLSRNPDGLRPWLLGLQGLAVLVVVVLAVPTRRSRR